MISVNNLTKEYNKVKVLSDVSFTVKKGDLLGIIGSNGAGKSTLVSIIAQIIQPTSGSVTLGEGSIGYVPQEITLFPNLTVKENLNFWDTISNSHSRKERRQNVHQIAELAQLQDYLNKKVKQLSGGLKRRLNLAVALLSHPDILIMDEPTVGMDISSRTNMVDFIKELSATGKTIIYISHHPDEIESLCNHIVCLNEGQLVFDGSLDQLKARYPKAEKIHDLILKVSRASQKGEANEATYPYSI